MKDGLWIPVLCMGIGTLLMFVCIFNPMGW